VIVELTPYPVVDEGGFVNNILRVVPAPVKESVPKPATSAPAPSGQNSQPAPSINVEDTTVETAEASSVEPTLDIPTAAEQANSVTQDVDIPRVDDADDELDSNRVLETPVSERGPLFHHETSYESDQVPLLPHEIGSLESSPVLSAKQQPQSPRSPISLNGASLDQEDSPAFPEPDLNDPSLERIDTSQQGIMETIRRLSSHESLDGAPLRPSHSSHSNMDAIDEEEDDDDEADVFDEGVPIHSPKDKKSVLEDYAHHHHPARSSTAEADLSSSLDGAQPEHSSEPPAAVRRKPFTATAAEPEVRAENPRALPTPPMTPREHPDSGAEGSPTEPAKDQAQARQKQQEQPRAAVSPVAVIVGGALALFCCNFVLGWFR